MAPNKVSVTVKYATPGTQPPIYLAGSFSDPEWQPQEMQYTTDESNEHEFYKAIEVEEGKEYQYKFRIGEGEWWLLDEAAEIATDNIGNRNNRLFVPIQEESIANPTPPKSPKMESSTDGTAVPIADINKAEVVQTKINDTTSKDGAAATDKADSEPEVKQSGIIVPVKAETEVKYHAEDIEVRTKDSPAAIDNVKPEPKSKKDNEDITHAYFPPASDKNEIKNDENIKAAIQDSAIVLPAVVSPEFEDTKPAKLLKQDQDGKLMLPHFDEVNKIEEDKNAIGDKTSSPTLVVEKVDSEPHHGDDFGPDATVGQKDAHLLRAQDAEPDYVVVRSQTPIPEVANVAAEVAETAAVLDEEPPTPPISDEEAGRIGFRRMSNTPIPEVAETAAEVAQSAAILDKEEPSFKIEMPPPRIEEEMLDSGATTPWEERAPRFAYECPTLPTGPLQPSPVREAYEARGYRDPFEQSVIDYNDPSIVVFPSSREAILEQVRDCQRRLPEDPVMVDKVPLSPVIGSDRYPERELPSPSPNMLPKHDDRSPSLDSIPEEDRYQEEIIAALPRAFDQPKFDADYDGVGGEDKDTRVSGVDVQEVEAPSDIVKSTVPPKQQQELDGSHISPPQTDVPPTPFVQDDNKQLGEDGATPKKIVMPAQGPSITVLPATPGSSLKNRGSESYSKPIDTAKASAIEEENGRGHLTSRKQPSPIPERPLTPTSMRGKDAKSKNFLKAFLNLVFVEWIGGLLMRLCGGGRNT